LLGACVICHLNDYFKGTDENTGQYNITIDFT
jgi:hypothetical protein